MLVSREMCLYLGELEVDLGLEEVGRFGVLYLGEDEGWSWRVVVGRDMWICATGHQFKVFRQFFLLVQRSAKWAPLQCDSNFHFSQYSENPLEFKQQWMKHSTASLNAILQCEQTSLDTLWPSCQGAQYKRLCNESIGAAWKGFVLSAITANWSFVPTLKVPSWPLWIARVGRIHQLLGDYQEF